MQSLLLLWGIRDADSRKRSIDNTAGLTYDLLLARRKPWRSLFAVWKTVSCSSTMAKGSHGREDLVYYEFEQAPADTRNVIAAFFLL